MVHHWVYLVYLVIPLKSQMAQPHIPLGANAIWTKATASVPSSSYKSFFQLKIETATLPILTAKSLEATMPAFDDSSVTWRQET